MLTFIKFPCRLLSSPLNSGYFNIYKYLLSYFEVKQFLSSNIISSYSVFTHKSSFLIIFYFRDIARNLGLKSSFSYDSPALKALLMIKCYLLDINLPNQEYVLDLKQVLDQIIRIIHVSYFILICLC